MDPIEKGYTKNQIKRAELLANSFIIKRARRNGKLLYWTGAGYKNEIGLINFILRIMYD